MSENILRRVVDAPEQGLYIPGQGFVDFRLRNAVKAVEEYDDRLILARHEYTGDWVAFVQLGPDRMFPVIGFGRDLPEPDEIRRILEKHDTRRHGEKILRDIQEHNDRLQKEIRDRADEGSGIAAEAMEWGVRKMTGNTSKIFVPRGI